MTKNIIQSPISKHASLLLIAILFSAVAMAQTFTDSSKYFLSLIRSSRADTNRVVLLNRLGAYYISKTGMFKTDLDTALPFLNQAIELSRSLHADELTNASIRSRAGGYVSRGQMELGKKDFKQLSDLYHQQNDVKREAEIWVFYGYSLQRGYPSESAECYIKALALLKSAPQHDRNNETDILVKLGDAHYMDGKLDIAEKELNQAIDEYKAIGNKKLHYAYELLGSIYAVQGLPDKQLDSYLKCLNSVIVSGDSSDIGFFIFKIGWAYRNVGMNEKSIEYFDRFMARPTVTHADFDYYFQCLNYKVLALLDENKHQEALSTIISGTTKVQTRNDEQKIFVEYAYVSYYKAVHNYEAALPHMLNAFHLSEKDSKGKTEAFNGILYYSVSALYIKLKQFDNAEIYLNMIGTPSSNIYSPDNLGAFEWARFKIDSSRHNYTSAIQHYENYQDLTILAYNETKNRQLQEVQAKYETVQKEKSIADLKIKDKVKGEELQKSNYQRDLLIFGTLFFVLLAGLAYKAFLTKRKTNAALLSYQQEIQVKNESLESLNHRQESLLMEKEWLLREIHHRVKNNLQTTMSLLNMQSENISNIDALNAIRDSQRRMHSMSLIHQRLYQSENMAFINMEIYIKELVDYISESFGDPKNVVTDTAAHGISLDVAFALPLGLIINEVMTNAYKYAFPDKMSGQILLNLEENEPGSIELCIKDNGVGISKEFDQSASKSLGLRLMKGLADQIGGTFDLTSDNGTIIRVVFENIIAKALH